MGDGLFDDSSWISAYADGELNERDRERAAQRIATDASAARELSDVVAARDGMRSLPVREPPAGWIDSIVARIGERADAREATHDAIRDPAPAGIGAAQTLVLRQRAVPVAAALGAAAVVAFAMLLPSGRDVTPELPALADAHIVQASVTDPISQLSPLVVPARFEP